MPDMKDVAGIVEGVTFLLQITAAQKLTAASHFSTWRLATRLRTEAGF
jgi:hypothetical protein